MCLFLFQVTQTEAAARPNDKPIVSFQVSKTQNSQQFLCPDITNCKVQTMFFTVSYKVDNCVHDIPLMTVSSDHVIVTRSVAGSAPLGGSFSFSFEGKTTAVLSTDIGVNDLRNELEKSFGSTFHIFHVHKACHLYQFDLKWINRGGDLPLMEPNGSMLTGDIPTIKVLPRVEGGAWIRPLRGDMLRLPELNPQV